MVLNIMDRRAFLSRLSSGKTRKQGCLVWLMVASVRYTLEANKRLSKVGKNRYWFRESLNVALPFAWRRRW